MIIRRYIVPAYVAGVIFALPYAVPLTLFVLAFDDADQFSTFSKKSLVAGIILHALALIPFLYYMVARVFWKTKSDVILPRLYGWPTGAAFLSSIFVMAFLNGRISWLVSDFAVPALFVATSLFASWTWTRFYVE